MFAFLPGVLTSMSLIMAIGAQNAFVIRQALTRKHVLVMVLICATSDALLILAGIAGLGAVIQGLPWLFEVLRWFGVAYLTWFGINSLRSAFKGESMDAATAESKTLKQVIVSLLGFTFLNPHVYLDTVILLGSIGTTFGDSKWIFAAGASLGSLIWFFSIGYGAKAASRFMSKPLFWKVLDIVIAVIMFAIATMLAFYSF
jgi:L-lysine exporter family protein LysE/ArgO